MHGEFLSVLGLKRELEITIKKEISHLDSKIYNGENKLNTRLTNVNAMINEMVLISGWFRASNNLIYKRFTDSVNYATAKTQCKVLGARLVSTGIRNNQVKSEIFSKDYLTGANAWIGLDDISNEGTWIWSDGVNESPSGLWESSQPDGGRIENCVVNKLFASKLGLHDYSCSDTHRFVCEKEFAW
ncbi:lectin-like [Styela clava]